MLAGNQSGGKIVWQSWWLCLMIHQFILAHIVPHNCGCFIILYLHSRTERGMKSQHEFLKSSLTSLMQTNLGWSSKACILDNSSDLYCLHIGILEYDRYRQNLMVIKEQCMTRSKSVMDKSINSLKQQPGNGAGGKSGQNKNFYTHSSCKFPETLIGFMVRKSTSKYMKMRFDQCAYLFCLPLLC